jgi:hypothetical protein
MSLSLRTYEPHGFSRRPTGEVRLGLPGLLTQELVLEFVVFTWFRRLKRDNQAIRAQLLSPYQSWRYGRDRSVTGRNWPTKNPSACAKIVLRLGICNRGIRDDLQA